MRFGVGESAPYRRHLSHDLVRDLLQTAPQRIKISLRLFALGLGEEAELLGSFLGELVQVCVDLSLQLGEYRANRFGFHVGPLFELSRFGVLDGL